jgi:hypothetical protein
MKNWIKAKHRAAACAAIFSIVISTVPANAGILALLRGDAEAAPQQRVAFVGAAEVKQVQGVVERLSGVDRWESLAAGARLIPGDVVRTTGGTVLLCMKESRSFVKITPNTLVRLVEVENGWDLGIVSGREEQSGFVVRSCRGGAFVADATGEWRPIRVNEVLASGTALRTEAGAVVDLFQNSYQQPLRIPGSAWLKLDDKFATRMRIQPSFASIRP